MARTLDNYLHDRAKSDCRDLLLLKRLISSAVQLPQQLQPCTVYSLVNDPNVTHLLRQVSTLAPSMLDSPADIHVNKETLQMAGVSGLNLAGEAAKVIERTNPELIKQYPDFPWIPIKRLRDYYSHPGRFSHDSEREKKEAVKAEREFTKLLGLMRANEQCMPPSNDDATTALAAGMRLFAGILYLQAATFSQETVPLTGTPEVSAASAIIKCHESSLPLIVAEQGYSQLMNNIGDTIERVSCLYRHRDESPLNDKKLRTILSLRDRSAHFGTTLKPGSWCRKPQETFKMLKEKQNILDSLEVLPPDSEDGIDSYSQLLATDYKKSLLGKAPQDPVSAEIVENALEKILTAKMNTRMTDAYLKATCELTRTNSVKRAAEILDYVLAEGNNLKQPEVIKQRLVDCPHAIRYAAKRFLDNVVSHTAPPGEARIHRGGQG